jgi:hypothetical protein
MPRYSKGSRGERAALASGMSEVPLRAESTRLGLVVAPEGLRRRLVGPPRKLHHRRGSHGHL